jgi:hypothetical protein
MIALQVPATYGIAANSDKTKKAAGGIGVNLGNRNPAKAL